MNNTKLTAFIAGPSNNGIKNLYTFGHITEADYPKYIDSIARFLNSHFEAIGVLPDIGVPLDVAKALHSIPDRTTKIKGFYPKYGNTPTITGNLSFCDEAVEINGGWAEMNTQPSKNFDVMLCLGLSAGVFTEIAHTKVHRLWSHKTVYVLIDERVVSSHLNAELESDVTVMYFNSAETLLECINKIKEEK